MTDVVRAVLLHQALKRHPASVFHVWTPSLEQLAGSFLNHYRRASC